MLTRLTFISTGRSDFSQIAEVVRACRADPQFVSRLVLCNDIDEIMPEVKAFLPFASVVPLRIDYDGDSCFDVSLRISRLIAVLTEALRQNTPDCVVVVGDRYELLAVLSVIISLRLPLCHISGGECSFGAMDEQIRHAVTKGAHVHCVAHPNFAARLSRLGEESWRIHITGDPGLDSIKRGPISSAAEIQSLLGLPMNRETVVVAYHPVTGSPEKTMVEWQGIAETLDHYDGTIVVTGPNADPQSAQLRERQIAWCKNHPKRLFTKHLGSRHFLGLLNISGCLLGNSSSGIWEGCSLKIPFVNIGCRQDGRLRGPNVIDVPETNLEDLRRALRLALSASFHETLDPISNPYGDGYSAPRIVQVLKSLPAREKLLVKRFQD